MQIFRAEFWLPFFWGLAVIASWIGWGSALYALMGLKRGPRVDWALKAAWGICVTLLMGGIALCFKVSSFNLIGIITLVGIGLCAYAVYEQLKRPRERERLTLAAKPKRWVWYLPAIGLAVFWLLGSIEAAKFNWADDLTSYMVFTRRILFTGGLEEPFSWRRLSTYGGQQYLQAQMLVVGSDFHYNILELGLMPIVLAGLVYGLLRPRSVKQHAMAGFVIFMVLFIPVPRINAQSQCSGAVVFLAFLRTLMLRRTSDAQGYKIAALVGLVAAGISTLRMNFLPGVVISMALAYGVDMLRSRKQWKPILLHGLTAAGAFAAVLLPWALALYASSRSLYFPAMPGYFRADYQIMDIGWGPWMKTLWTLEFLITAPVLVLLLPAVLAGRKRFVTTIIPVYIAAFITSCATTYMFTTSDYFNLYRYSYGLLFTAAIAAICWYLRRPRVRWQAMIAGGLLLLVPAANVPGVVEQFEMNADWIRMAATNPMVFADKNLVDRYREAQRMVPTGEKFFAMTSHPVFFDYERNPIYNIDLPGAASPDPGLPIMEGPEAVAKYLKGLGIKYIIYINFDRDPALYNRRYYSLVHITPGRPLYDVHDRHITDILIAPKNLKLMANLEAMAPELGDRLDEANPPPGTRRSPLRVVRLK